MPVREAKEQANARAKRWYANNRAHAIAYSVEKNREWRKKNPEKTAISRFKAQLKRAYGMTIEQYDALLVEQGGLCAICKGLPCKQRGKALRLHVDHDHNTGAVRGLLCSTCNMSLHKLEKDLEWADHAKAYLIRSRTCQL